MAMNISRRALLKVGMGATALCFARIELAHANDLELFGTTQIEINEFVGKMQRAFHDKDSRVLRKLSSPRATLFDNDRRIFLDNSASIRRCRHIIFSEKFRTFVKDIEPSEFFLNSEGIMFGDGQIWIENRCLDAECSNSKLGLKVLNTEAFR